MERERERERKKKRDRHNRNSRSVGQAQVAHTCNPSSQEAEIRKIMVQNQLDK
jgi:hypothetical protein